MKKIKALTIAILFLAPIFVFAHQPRITENRQTLVPDPEISKAYYAKLTGEPDTYIIESNEPFKLYVNVLVPDISGQRKDVSAIVTNNGKQISFLDGLNFEWEKFYEPFGADTYWMGPEYEADVKAGKYEIKVFSPDNDSKYSLAIGKIEAFDGKEGLNALTIIPELKKDFFEESPISFIKSPFGWGLIVAMYLLAAIVGFIYRYILRRFSQNSVRKLNNNINKKDRIIRLIIGIGLLFWAMLTTWNPIVIFFSGFALFEAIFSWCGFYAAIGKNTC